jgi:ribonuclease R
MDFSITALLANFTEDKLVAPKALEKKLDCTDDTSLRKLQITLDALEKIGVLVKDRGRYRRVVEEGVIEGKLRCSSRGFCFAIQDVEGAEDIYVRESQLNNAWNGDRVLVKVTKEGSRRRSPEGEVRLILERANPSVLARIKQDGEHFWAEPLDDRLVDELLLEGDHEQFQQAISQLVYVQVTRYRLGSRPPSGQRPPLDQQHPPLGQVARILGSDTTASDVDIVCCKHDLPSTFPDTVLEATKALPNKLGKAEIKKRLDLRHLTTVTIKSDNEQAKHDSLDDAITLDKTDTDAWRLGIHIADVSYYVAADSAIDREAQKRGVSVYLGDLVVPMLPDPLTEDLCAFQTNKERLALSVLATLDSEGQVIEYEIQPTVIQVDYQLSYQQAEAILERNQDNPRETDIQAFAPIFDLLDNLANLSRALKKQRQQRGAFELNLPSKPLANGDTDPVIQFLTTPKFHYDDEGALGAMVVSPWVPTHAMIAELMLLANQLVANHLHALEVPSIYRVHSTPDPENVQELMKLVASMGIELHLEQEDAIRPQDYQHFTQKFAESDAERVLTYLLLKTLKPAFYSTQPKAHFGLALEQGYTHFTSPVRRYPDLLVHRVLHAVFEQGRDRKSTRSKEIVSLRHSSCHGQISWNVLPTEVHQALETRIHSVAVHLTERERIAQEAENDLEGLKKAELMREHTGEIFHGLITGVQSYGLFVELEELLVEGLVHVSSLKDDWYEYRTRHQTLVGRKSRKQYRLGDRIEVQVKSVDYYRQQIDLIAVSGGSQAADEDDLDEEEVIPDEDMPEE